jgi:AcrR family transcriptional regulator
MAATTAKSPAAHALRREPQQQRSRDRIARVLEAAERVLVEEGPAGLTTTRVAEVAGISVGSLYQYFPDKDAIVSALALRYVEQFEALANSFEPRGGATVTAVAGEILDAFVDAFRARPGFRALWFGGLRTEQLRAATRPSRTVIAAAAARLLSSAAPHAQPAHITRVSRTMVLVADGLLREAFRIDPDGDPDLIEDARSVLDAYLSAQLTAPIR